MTATTAATPEQAARILLSARRVLLLCHQFPDGDTLGAGSALCRGLRRLGKRAAVRCSDPIGPKFAFLFRDLPDDDFEPDLVATVDVADISLLGEPLVSRWKGMIGLSIDHHASGFPFAESTCADPDAAATCEVVLRVLKLMHAEIDKPMASALYTGISTDTGCFRFINTTARTHRIAAELMDDGADAVEIDRAMFDSKSRARLELERRVLDGMRFSDGGRIAVIRLTKKLLAQTGATEDDLDGISTLSRAVEGVRIGVMLREKEDGSFKISLRARPPVNASKICAEFGGGGHRGAAGCTLPPPLREAEARIVSAAERYLEQNK